MADPERETENLFRRSERFDRFTESARRVLGLAQEEASRLNHSYMGTEHLLLGLSRLDEDDPAQKVLREFGIRTASIRDAVMFIVGRGDHPVSDIGLTPRSRKVIELAVAGAREFNHHYLGTEHLLLGLVDEHEGIAAGVLESLGVNAENVRSAIKQVLLGTEQPKFLMGIETRVVLFAWWENFFNNPEVPDQIKLEELTHLQERLKEAQVRANKKD